jgi:hypothetical protein
MSDGDDQATDDKLREGVEHLQNAALEFIAAARIFLDVAEEIVRDPAPFVARAAKPGTAPTTGHDDRVQHIRVV